MLNHDPKVVRLYLPVCLVNCVALPYFQHLGILTFESVHEASATSKGEYPVK